MSNINAVLKEMCTGCSACMTMCPQHCIEMKEDNEGFNYPTINFDKCIECGLCLKKCPAYNTVKLHENINAYAATGKNKKLVNNSSSGGAFVLCAQYVIDKLKGYVCGAVLDDDLILRHKIVNTMRDVEKMQGSKYIQSDIGNCYGEIIRLLNAGEYVLFSGTPCQVAGLCAIIKNGKDHLFTLDLICHGVPSSAAFSKYIKKMYGEDYYDRFTFRQRNKYLLTSYSYSYRKKNKNKKKNSQENDENYVKIEAFQDPFYQSFMEGNNYRQSCYTCRYAQSRRVGDITIGDCASSNSYKNLLGKSLSSVIINTPQGKKIWENIKEQFDYEIADYSKEVKLNKQLHEPVKRPNKRDEFYDDLLKMGNHELKEKYCPKRGLKEKIKHFILLHVTVNTRIKLKKILRRI